MNKVEAIIRPEKLSTVKKALIDAGFRGMNVISGSGQGVHEGVSRAAGRGTITYVDYTLPNVKVEVVVTDENTERIIELIKDAATTGKAGDGRIFVSPVAAAIRIDSSERDAATL